LCACKRARRSPEDIDSTLPESSDRLARGPNDCRNRDQRSASAFHAGGWIFTPAVRPSRPNASANRRGWITPAEDEREEEAGQPLELEGRRALLVWNAGRENLTDRRLPRVSRSHLNVRSPCSFVYILEIQLGVLPRM